MNCNVKNVLAALSPPILVTAPLQLKASFLKKRPFVSSIFLRCTYRGQSRRVPVFAQLADYRLRRSARRECPSGDKSFKVAPPAGWPAVDHAQASPAWLLSAPEAQSMVVVVQHRHNEDIVDRDRPGCPDWSTPPPRSARWRYVQRQYRLLHLVVASRLSGDRDDVA